MTGYRNWPNAPQSLLRRFKSINILILKFDNLSRYVSFHQGSLFCIKFCSIHFMTFIQHSFLLVHFLSHEIVIQFLKYCMEKLLWTVYLWWMKSVSIHRTELFQTTWCINRQEWLDKRWTNVVQTCVMSLDTLLHRIVNFPRYPDPIITPAIVSSEVQW